jgi:2-oxoglutarate dehydrogenase complex dehydrogenase (E1) component-like enzyme
MKSMLANSIMKQQRVATMGFRATHLLSKPTGAYQDQMYDQWRNDPSSVDSSWANHFAGGNQ